ncbi:MAG: hypothetical protein FWF08_09680 [Oscillospiraceae bacterium]|nr:hypothetical protein [Oscillospiraceae bacterium]
MKFKAVKVIACFLCLCMPFVCALSFGGCGKNQEDPDGSLTTAEAASRTTEIPSETGDVFASVTETAAETTTAAATTTETATETTTETAAETTAEEETAETTAAPPDPQNADPEDDPHSGDIDAASFAEVLDFYKTAYSKAAANAKSITTAYENNKSNPDILDIGVLTAVGRPFMDMFLKEEFPNNMRTDVANFLPPEDVKGSLATTADMLADAEMTDMGSYIEVYLKLKPTKDDPEINPSPGKGINGTIINVFDADVMFDAAGYFANLENPEIRYYDTVLTAKVEKATGNLTEIYYSTNVIISIGNVSIKPLGFPSMNNVKVGLDCQQKEVITWD